MLATIEQSRETKASRLPPVIFDAKNHTIQATVTISRGEQPGTFRHRVDPLSAVGPAGSNWTLTWILEPSEGISANFVGQGIIVPKPDTRLPDGVDRVLSSVISPTQGQLTFTHNVSDVNVLRYDLDLDIRDTDNHPLERAKDIVIDPTISVVKEPIDG